MGPKKYTPKEYLEMALKSPYDIISKERAIQGVSYPLLAGYYDWIRKINTVQNKKDDIIETNQLINEFTFICEHNLLFFLIATGRFDLIRELFKDTILSKAERHFIHLIEIEHQHLHNIDPTQGQVKKVIAPPPEEEKNLDSWSNYQVDLPPIARFNYFQMEMKRTTYQYYVAQSNILYDVYNVRLVHMHTAVDIIKNDKSIPQDIKDQAEALFKVFTTERKAAVDAIYRTSCLHPDGTLDLEAIERRFTALEEEYARSFEFHDFLKNNHHLSKDLTALYHTLEDLTEKTKVELKVNETEFKQQMEILQTYSDQACKETIEEIDQKLHHAIQALEGIPPHLFTSDAHREQVDDSIARLKEHRQDIKTTKTFEGLNHILAKCAQELEAVEQFCKKIPHESVQLFVQEIKVFKEMIHTHKEQTGQLTPTAPPSQEDELITAFNNYKHLKPSAPEIDDEYLEQQDEVHLIEAAPLNFSDEKLIPSAPKEEKEEKENSKETCSKFKFEIMEVKNGGNENLLKVGEKDQLLYEKGIKLLSKVLSDIKEDNSATPENLDTADEVEVLIKNIKGTGFDQINTSLLQSLYEKVSKLECSYDSIDSPKRKLSTVFDLLEHDNNSMNQI